MNKAKQLTQLEAEQYDRGSMNGYLSAILLILGTGCQSLPPADESFARGNALLDTHDPSGAIQAYNAAVHENPRFSWAYNNRGLARAALMDFEGAIKDYTACLGLPDPFPEAYYNRGVALFHQGRKGEAIVDFTEALKLNPQYARAHAGRGLVLASGGDRTAALADYRKALELAPADWSDRKSVEAEIARISQPKQP